MTMAGIKAEVEFIDPERAQQLLARMAPNRNVRTPKVDKYAADMASGRWVVTGEGIKLTADGVVIDGEHRLRAVVKSGATIEILVVYGVELTDRVAMDTGATRTLADHLKFLGETQCNELAAGLMVLYSRRRGVYARPLEASHQQLIQELTDHPGIRQSVLVVNRAARQLRMPRGICVALHYDMADLDASDAEDFWSRLYSGVGLNEKDPIAVLRRRLEDNAMSNGRKLDRSVTHAYIIKAWNAYREGRDMAILKWTRGGSSPEPFPELI